MTKRGRPPGLRLTREMLPEDVLIHLPDEVDDTQIPFWWAAFERGRASTRTSSRRQASPTPAIPAPDMDLSKPLDLGSDYGDSPDQGQGLLVELIEYAKGWHPNLNEELFTHACKTYPEIQGWLRGRKLPGQRVMQGVIEEMIIKTKGKLLDES